MSINILKQSYIFFIEKTKLTIKYFLLNTLIKGGKLEIEV